MAITTTLGALADAEPALGRLTAQRLPIATAYRVAKLARLVAAETQDAHHQKQALIRELGKARPATPEEQQTFGTADLIEVTPMNRAAYQERMVTLATIAVAIDAPRILLADLAGIAITPADLLALEPLLDAGETTAPAPTPRPGRRRKGTP